MSRAGPVHTGPGRIPTTVDDQPTGGPGCAGQDGEDQRTRRYPCPWCGDPDRWPDRCSEALDAPDPRCASLIEARCTRGDHRRCDRSACVVADRWHEPVRRAGVAAARAAGAVWAVVSTIEDVVTVVGTEDDLDRASVLLRVHALIRSDSPNGPDCSGLVYVVRGADGGMF